jgi:hypothetical protein
MMMMMMGLVSKWICELFAKVFAFMCVRWCGAVGVEIANSPVSADPRRQSTLFR